MGGQSQRRRNILLLCILLLCPPHHVINIKNTRVSGIYCIQTQKLYLLTNTALVGELLLEAGHTEVAGVFWDEGLGSYWLLAAVTQEAGLMPAVPLVFNFAGSWHTGREQLNQHMVPR